MAEAFVDYKSKSKKRADWAILKQLFYADQTIGPYNNKKHNAPSLTEFGEVPDDKPGYFFKWPKLAATLAGMHERKKEN